MEVLNIEGTQLVRFVTTTDGWATLSRHNICVPDKWPYMMVEILVADDGSVLLSTVEGIPKNTARSLHSQGVYFYAFEELPDAIVTAVLGHFRNLYRKLMKRVDSLLPASRKPQLVWTKPPSAVLTER